MVIKLSVISQQSEHPPKEKLISVCVWVDPYASALPNINSCVGKEDKLNRPHYTVYKGSSIIPSY